MAGPDYIVDIEGLAHLSPNQQDQGVQAFHGRPWLAVHWRCCQVYSRIYRNRDGSAYAGTCPTCGKPVKVSVGPGGTDARFFEAR